MGTTHDSCEPTKLPHDNVIELDEVKARTFLKNLTERPFVTVVLDDGVFRVYTKGMTESAARDVLHGTVHQMDGEVAETMAETLAEDGTG